jgi:DNA segregation ATPase FtsK/SpoIIIE, S-DNA-T family
MSEPRKVQFDVEAIVLAGVCVFLWVSLLTYDTADPVGPLVAPLNLLYQPTVNAYPPNASTQNACGWAGALAAQILVEGLGIGSLLLVTGLTALTVWMFRVQSNYVPIPRQLGWLLVILACTTLATLLNIATPFGSALGAGGTTGALASTWLNAHFATVGSVILTLAVLLAGLLLSTDYWALRVMIWLVAAAAAVLLASLHFLQHLGARLNPLAPYVPRSPATHGPAGLQLAGAGTPAAEGVSVRIRGQQVDGRAAAQATPTAASAAPLVSVAKRLFGGAGAAAKPTGQMPPSTKPEGLLASVAAAAEGLVAKGLSVGAGGGGANPASSTAGHSAPGTTAAGNSAAGNSAAGNSATANSASAATGAAAGSAGGKAKSLKSDINEQALGASLDSDASVEDYEDSQAADGDDEEGHLESPADASGPRVKRKKKGAAEKTEWESLEHLDDTSLPEGTEEYVLPGVDLLVESDDINFEDQAVEVRRKAKILEKTFSDFGFNVRVVEIETGPVIAQYEVELEAGLRLSKITSLADDLAIALRVPSVRIVAPIPGKNTVGIEVPNETRQVVRLREVIEESAANIKKHKIPLFLGKDVSGNPLTVDLASLPHLLIAGRTGTGKSVCLNAIIASVLMTKRPDEVRMLMIDPKMVELSGYARLPHLMHPVVTDMRKAEAILAWAVDKMEERYALLARAGVRHLVNYNQLGREELMERLKPESPEEEEAIPDHLPFIVIVADEMADLMMTSGKEVEQHIIRLAQKSRAVGIHLILATQKPTVDVITGLIKSNLPARISFQVASRTDSRVVLDEMGADKLLGNGDMLFLWPGTSMLLRGQGTYLSDEEINRVVDHCSTGEQNFVNELVNLKLKTEDGEEGGKLTALKKRDDLYEAAVDVVVREGRGSVSLLQRTLGIGYGRAARLIDFMAEDGIVGHYNGSQAREVVISIADWEAMMSGGSPGEGGGSKGGGGGGEPVRRNRIRRDEGWDEEAEAPQPHAPQRPGGLKIQHGESDSAPPEAGDGEDLWSDEDDQDRQEIEAFEGGQHD